MPWLQSDVFKEKTKFVLEWETRWKANEGRVNVSELCRKFGISRDTGHLWIRRFRNAGHDLKAIEEKSKAPLTTPTRVSERIENAVVDARKLYPTWGARKLRYYLMRRHPGIDWPSASCMSAIIARHGLVRPRRKRRRRAVPISAPFSNCDAPNAVWCIDFKGKFRTLDGEWCHVLTVIDAYSRFLVRCEAVRDPDGDEVERILDSAFQEFGLPEAMRSDNGPPFASTGAGGLTSLNVWWLKLGIRLERIEPGKPQQNGRQERVHLTLEEVVGTPAANLRAQQKALDLWRQTYNEVRPHEALSMNCPVDVYRRSRRRYPCKFIEAMSPELEENFILDKQGRLRWRGRWIHISFALRAEIVQVLWQDDLTHFDVYFGPILLGTFDQDHLERGLKIPRRKRTRHEVSGISLD
jgi:transposase InsO family protein